MELASADLSRLSNITLWCGPVRKGNVVAVQSRFTKAVEMAEQLTKYACGQPRGIFFDLCRAPMVVACSETLSDCCTTLRFIPSFHDLSTPYLLEFKLM
jgi:hypothetical protein